MCTATAFPTLNWAWTLVPNSLSGNVGFPRAFLKEKGSEKLLTGNEQEVLANRENDEERMLSGGHTSHQEEFMTCSICEDIFSPPILQCSHGHSYCKQCWLRWIEKQPSCPQCRVPVSTATLVRNIQLESIMEHYQVKIFYINK